MSGLRVDNLKGSPTFPDGVVVTGEASSTSFNGNLTGNVTGNVTGIVTGNVTGNIAGTTGSFNGNVSVGGTLLYGDVTNVDSVGVITARGGIKIGAGQSVSAVSGTITYYGDGSQLGGIESGFSNFIASGNIGNGDTVVINTDGTVGVVTGSNNPSAGTPVVYESSEVFYCSAVYDSSNQKVVIAYTEAGGSSWIGKAVVGTVSGTSISFGTPVTFFSASASYISASFDSSNNKVVIAFRNNSGHGAAIVGTVSGTSISFGSATVFESASTSYIGSTFDSSNNKVVIVYTDEGNSNYGTAIVGTVSGTSISFGSPVVFESANTLISTATFDSSNNKVVIAYKDRGNSDYGTAIVGTVSGTSISFGSAVLFNSANSIPTGLVYDSSNQKVVVAYRDIGNSNYGTAKVGTVSGTSISFGSATVFETATTNLVNATFDSTNNKVIVAYRDDGNSNYGTAIVGTVSGTSISFGSPVVFESARADDISLAYDSTNGKAVVAYQDHTNSDYGTASVISSSLTNLTSTNFLGFSNAAYTNGQTAKIQIAGGVNSGQTGLTTARTYYVQKNGSLGTTADNPSVVAGTSISGTQIIVKG